MQLISPLVLLLYAITIIMMLLGVKIREMNPRTRALSIAYLIALLAGNAAAAYLLGPVRYGQFYPLLAHVPVVAGFAIFSRYHFIKLLFVQFTAVVFSAVPVLSITALRTYYQIGRPQSDLLFFLCCGMMILFVYKVLKDDFNYILENCESRRFWLFCVIPLLYFIYGYARTGYDSTKYFAIGGFFVSQIPTLIVFATYVLLVRVFRATRETQRLENEKNMVNLQLEAAELYLSKLKVRSSKRSFTATIYAITCPSSEALPPMEALKKFRSTLLLLPRI